MINNLDHCPHCESQQLDLVKYSDDVDFRGGMLRVNDLHIYSCASCGEEVMTQQQFRANSETIANAKAQKVAEERRALGLLQAEEVRKIRELLGITQRAAAGIFGGGANAFSKYECGLGKQSEPMDRLLRLVSEVPEAARWIIERYGQEHSHALETSIPDRWSYDFSVPQYNSFTCNNSWPVDRTADQPWTFDHFNHFECEVLDSSAIETGHRVFERATQGSLEWSEYSAVDMDDAPRLAA
ncbi:type II TA system antitoxin MqsA family protein [Frateuria sp. GZRe14]|uniref:type II TA system antitoxin MqsA family protein n=1 Tax=Frateuria sp. GZRe14 TaxID=3351534 RepID=UPI003EDBAB6A